MITPCTSQTELDSPDQRVGISAAALVNGLIVRTVSVTVRIVPVVSMDRDSKRTGPQNRTTSNISRAMFHRVIDWVTSDAMVFAILFFSTEQCELDLSAYWQLGCRQCGK